LNDTKTRAYAARLTREQTAAWKNILHVQAPYSWNLRRLRPGRTVDIGCGIGRNLATLAPGSVGVDHNEAAVAACRERGLDAYTPTDFIARFTSQKGVFDSLLFAHVLEHMTMQAAIECVGVYMPYLKPASKIILITPQEAGFSSDPTHVEFMPFSKLASILGHYEFDTSRAYSFPFPRWAGRYFRYNEFVTVGQRSR
jgi:2-polyprenyl-3-methyl-5-hydroxy-6-metoxy-1,4-benzoquinol methylase